MRRPPNQIAIDLTNHLSARLHKLLEDGANTYEIAGIDEKDVMSLMLSVVMQEAVALTSAIQLSEEDFIDLCRHSYWLLMLAKKRKEAKQ